MCTIYIYIYIYIYVCVCVCVCVREREREREKKDRDWKVLVGMKTCNIFVSLYIYIYICVCVCGEMVGFGKYDKISGNVYKTSIYNGFSCNISFFIYGGISSG